jgi:protoporphyrinogen/coproporphyrinogen III oxidase
MNPSTVLVIGAGPAGLAAAHRLARRGSSVRVLDCAAAPGGRAADGGAFALDAGARTFAALAGAVGCGELLPLRPVRDLRLAAGRIVPIAPWRRRDAEGLLAQLRLARVERVVARFRTILRRVSSEAAERLDDRSVAEMAALYLPRDAQEGWIAPLSAAAGLGDPARASRIALMRLLAEAALGVELPGGPLAAFFAALARDARVELGAEATAIEARGAGFAVHVAGRTPIEADAVVLAVPARVALAIAAGVLTEPERGLLAEARTLPAVVLDAELARPLVPEATRICVGAGEAPIASVLHDPGGAGRKPAVRIVAAPASGAHGETADDVLAKELVAALDRLHPGAGAAVVSPRLRRVPEAYPLFPVGRYRAIARLRRIETDRLAVGRRLAFAGDHLAGPTLEDALRSGLRAADMLARE